MAVRVPAAISVLPLDNSYLRVIWDENSIGSLAREAGLTEVYYADLETFSVLGIWTRYRVRVYGVRGGCVSSPP